MPDVSLEVHSPNPKFLRHTQGHKSGDRLINLYNLEYPPIPNHFLLSARSEKYPETRQPIWQIAQEIMADVPPEIIAQLPTDGAEQHDHYLYGIPKREE